LLLYAYTVVTSYRKFHGIHDMHNYPVLRYIFCYF